ncbi:MAG: hypothetical protein WCA49_18300 [Candidatus Sulfotelmatobacter sp.]
MKLGAENRRNVILASVLGAVAVLAVAYQFIPSSSTIASTGTVAGAPASPTSALARPAAHKGSGSGSGKKERAPQSLDPTLHLQQLSATEQIKYEGTGRNIFISQAEDVVIPKAIGNGTTDRPGEDKVMQIQPPPPPTPIPLKFFGFSNQPGERKKVFLSKGDDVFIAGEGEIVDRRYKVVRISPTSVDIQDVVGSGPPQSIPLTQG